MTEDHVDQLGGGWGSTYEYNNPFMPYTLYQDGLATGHITCPGCSAPVQPGYLLNHASCSCGCSFCARCGALYLSSLGPEQQPAGGAAQQQQLVQTGSSTSGSGWLVTCSCGAVDKAAVAARWGVDAVACWPAEPRLQELLLHLLQLHQDQVVPLLSRQLLQRLQADTQLQWERVQQAVGAIQEQQHAEQLQQAAARSVGNAEQQPSSEFLPADATPCFMVNGRAARQESDAMQLDGEQRSAGAAAAAAALRITSASAAAAAATHTYCIADGSAAMQMDEPAAQSLLGWQQQEQRLLDIGIPAAAAQQLQEAWEQHLLLDLAADVAAAGQHQTAAAAQATLGDAAGLMPRPVSAGDPAVLQSAQGSGAGRGGVGRPPQQPGMPAAGWLPEAQPAAAAGAGLVVRSGAAVEPEGHGQLGLQDLLGGQPQQEPEPMMQDRAEQEEQQLAAEQTQQQQRAAGSRAALAVLAEKGGKLQLAGAAPWDEDDSSNSRPATSTGVEAMPQLSVFGLPLEAPPVLPHEPAVLLHAPAQEDQPGHARLFW